MVQKKPVPQPQAANLTAATARLNDARDTWTQAIYDALDTGASLREIANLAGVSHGTIETIARNR